MKYLSVCSGIEAATVAWHPLGWTPRAFAEIEAFPSAVLAHHYGSNLPGEPLTSNGVPNLGNMERYREWPDADIDVLVGGTPCQSFSVAGLRKGLADPRGNLALTFLGIADRYRPQWLIWENVPGVLSIDGGRAFGSILGGMAELGYGWAYRVLDAQYIRVDGFGRAVPQRRRRVFVVGHLGEWRRAGAVLFEPESLSGNPAPRRKAGQRAAPTISSRPTGGGGLGTDFDCDGGLIAFGGNRTSGPVDVAAALQAHAGPAGRQDFASETFLAVAPTLDANYGRLQGHDNQHIDSGAGLFVAGPVAASLTRGAESSGKGGYAGRRQRGGDMVATNWAVRRLMPIECERLQGFPDGYTDIPYRNKQAADGPRYKALGNSMAVNVMRWLGRRIDLVNAAAIAAE